MSEARKTARGVTVSTTKSDTHNSTQAIATNTAREHDLGHRDLAPDAAEAVVVEPQEVGVDPGESLHDDEQDEERDDDRDDDDVAAPDRWPVARLGRDPHDPLRPRRHE